MKVSKSSSDRQINRCKEKGQESPTTSFGQFENRDFHLEETFWQICTRIICFKRLEKKPNESWAQPDISHGALFQSQKWGQFYVATECQRQTYTIDGARSLQKLG